MDNQKAKEETARKIIYLRKERCWSQAQIARKISIPRPRYASYEERRAIIPHETIKRICAAYKITIDEFERMKIPAKPISII